MVMGKLAEFSWMKLLVSRELNFLNWNNISSYSEVCGHSRFKGKAFLLAVL